MYIWREKKPQCLNCFSVKKQWTEKIFRNVLQCFMQDILLRLRPSILYERKKLFNIFRHASFVKIRINILLHCIRYTEEYNNLKMGVRCNNIIIVLHLWPKNMLWVHEHIEYNYPYVKYYILLIFDLTETNIYTCKYCTGLWISWYKGEIKWGKEKYCKSLFKIVIY